MPQSSHLLPAPASEPVSARVPVLLVNDSRDEREMYAEFLQTKGFLTLQSSSADDALRLAEELQPAVVITDAALPGFSDGLAFTQMLKGNERTKHTPVIVLTGYVLDTHREAAEQAGCDLFLRKPCLPHVLLGEIFRVLTGRPSTPGR